MYEKEYEKLLEFIVKEFPDEIGNGDNKRGESAAQVAIRLLNEYKSLVVSVPVYRQLIDLEKEKEEILEKIDALTRDIQSIDLQLSRAIEKKLETGEYADVKWFMSAKNAKKAKRSEVIRLQRQLHKINSEIKASRGKTYERLFVEAAKDALSEEQYKTICRLAFDRMGKLEQYAKE